MKRRVDRNGDARNEAAIRALVERWSACVRARNIDGVLEHHSPDIVLFDVPAPVMSRGIDEYRESWERFFPWLGDSGTFEIRDLAVTAGDDVAFCHGLIRCRGSGAGGESAPLLIRLTVGYQKIEGQWTVMHEHHSEPSPN